MEYYRAIAVGFYLIAWFKRASKDGDITIEEIGEAVIGSLDAAGITHKFDVRKLTHGKALSD